MQPSFDLRPEKRVQSTSVMAYREIQPELAKREAEALALVRRYPAATSSELMAYACLRDPNTLRPRLTALEDRGLVTKGEKRQCRITGRTAFTWIAVHEGQE